MPNRYHIGNYKATAKLPRGVPYYFRPCSKVSGMVKRIGPSAPVTQYFQAWREIRGLSQPELAALINTTKASISRWETGERDPTLKVVAAIAYALDVHITDLFRHPNEPSADKMLRNQPVAKQEKAVELIEVYLKAS